MNCRVNVLNGELQGEVRSTCDGRKYYCFEGIPYAKPPVGPLRFRDPQEPESWEGVRDATKPGNKCAQVNPYANSSLIGSEDCLYLNVYTPMLPAEKIQNLPVIFCIHGGRLIVGYGDYHQPDYLFKNDVVLVTMNYRLHILGFLCLNIPECPGNAGLKDTIMALKWVKNNIRHFNGDPNNVTAFGESAGAAIATSFLTSKMADGLFHRIIAQSGNSLSDLYMIDDDPVEKARKVSSLLGKDLENQRDLYEYLMNIPIEDLVKANAFVEVNRPAYVVNAVFLPVVERKFDGVQCFFDEYPLVAIRENRFKKVPIIIGLNSHEGAYFARRDKNGRVAKEEDLTVFIPKYYFVDRRSHRAKQIANKLREHYFENKNKMDEVSDAEYVRLLSDAYFNRDLMCFVHLVSKFSNEIYLYRFCYDGNMNTRVLKMLGLKGATHGDIIQYEFYKKNKALLSTESDKKIVHFLSETWCNFAKYGKPSWRNQSFEWRPYKSDNKFCLKIDKEISTDTELEWDTYSLWSSLAERAKL